MNRGGQIIPSMLGLIDLFLPRCSERATMEELKQLLLDSGRWIKAHALFDRIRSKTLE
jgi:hypothetical protein